MRPRSYYWVFLFSKLYINCSYNMINFDLNYLLKRAATLKVENFEFLGRLKDVRSKVADKTFQSRAYGKRENKEISIIFVKICKII